MSVGMGRGWIEIKGREKERGEKGKVDRTKVDRTKDE